MEDEYGIKIVEHGTYEPAQTIAEAMKRMTLKQAGHDQSNKSYRKAFKITLDKPKFEKLLSHLKYFNDCLERFLPADEIRMLQQGLPCGLVPTANVETLRELSSSSQQLLALCAAAKSIKLTTTVSTPGIPMMRPENLLALKIMETLRPGGPAIRASACLEHHGSTEELVIDYKPYNQSLNSEQRMEVLRRLKALYLLFNHFSKNGMVEFRILPCIGLLQNPENTIRFDGFVFQHPQAGLQRAESLHQLLYGKLSVPLGDRFQLAQKLASAVLLLHSSKWLHKNIRSQNILFFRKRTAGYSTTDHITSPYLVGFSYARPDNSGEASMDRPDDGGPGNLDHYRHPNFNSGSTRKNDIYSLGIILFEIGHWRPVEKICGDDLNGTGKHIGDEHDVRRHLLDGCRKPLPSKMGTIYAAVVRRCLDGDFSSNSEQGGEEGDDDFIHDFWSSVVRELERCHA
ncbi:hypothetical protein MCOR25_007405 [Pyricularia grisea]|nr:hypothetical protein MCOR25_007405 [Pyricularia grisea]